MGGAAPGRKVKGSILRFACVCVYACMCVEGGREEFVKLVL